jgi:hypothetical protein
VAGLRRGPGTPPSLHLAVLGLLIGQQLAGELADRFIFLDPHATEFFCDWDKVANDTVALLRAEAGRDPYDRQLSDLIGELSTRSEEFRVQWAAHHVRIHATGVKRFHHPVVGDLELAFESFPLLPIPARVSSPTPPSRGHPPSMPCACWPAGSRLPTTSGSLRAPTTWSRLSRSRRPTDRVNLDEPQRADQQASSTLPDLLDHPLDHPDDPTGSIWINLDRRGIQSRTGERGGGRVGVGPGLPRRPPSSESHRWRPLLVPPRFREPYPVLPAMNLSAHVGVPRPKTAPEWFVR